MKRRAAIIGMVGAGRLGERLAERGHDVRIFSDDDEAEDVLDDPPELAVVAYEHGDGLLDLVARIKRVSPETSVLVYSAMASEADVLRAFGAGADDFVAEASAARSLFAKCVRYLEPCAGAAPERRLVKPPAFGEVVFGRYRLGECLGTGGFGAVFAAEDLMGGEGVALKLVNGSSNPDAHLRFLREFYVLAGLRHPNVVEVRDFGACGATLYCALEYVEGPTVYDWVQADGGCSQEELYGFVLGGLRALAALDGRGLLHRDLKPLNVVLRDGRVSSPVLIDFGLAKPGFDHGITSPDVILGSPGYMAPELIEQPPSRASDLFALGQVALYLMRGVDPFPDLCGFERLLAMRRVPTRVPREVTNPGLRRLLESLVAVLPEDRPQSAAEAAETLERISMVRAAEARWEGREVASEPTVPIGRRSASRRLAALDGEVV